MIWLKGNPYTVENMGTGFGHNVLTIGSDGVQRPRWLNMWLDGLGAISDEVSDAEASAAAAAAAGSGPAQA